MTRARSIRDLRGDDKGAVMLTGLFMSCFLIGALWFVIGIGDTIVFRDKMQEAADHGAFAAAALNAKGMNFISLCNLVLLAAVTVHIILGIAHDIALVACLVPPFVACPVWKNVRSVYTGYFNVLKPAAKAIHQAEVAASYAYPAMGIVEGFTIGRTYGGNRGTGPVAVVALSGTLQPFGTDYEIDFVRLQLDKYKKQGLPVTPRPMNYLCDKISRIGLNVIFENGIGIGGGNYPDFVKSAAKLVIGSTLQFRYCNDMMGGANLVAMRRITEQLNKADKQARTNSQNSQNNGQSGSDGEKVNLSKEPKEEEAPAGHGIGFDPGFNAFWGTDGPLVVMGKAGNGKYLFQTLATNVAPIMTDVSESRVGIGRGTKLGMQKYEVNRRPVGYFAKSEFFFDCDKTWDDASCNDEDNATFQIKWRARLRKFVVSESVKRLLEANNGEVPSLGQLRDVGGQIAGEKISSFEKLRPLINLVPGLPQ